MLTTLSLLALALPLPGGGSQREGVGNAPPVCDAGPVQFIECGGAQTSFQLDGSGSFDPDGGSLSFLWTVTGGGGLGCPTGQFDDPTSPTPIITFDTPGCINECGAIRLTVSDGTFTSTCTTALQAEDTLPPTCMAAADVLELWTTGYPMQADPLNTGSGVGVDQCDPMVSVSFMDLSVIPGIPPSGIEQVVTREWRADDNCGFFHTAIQTITFVGPSFFADSVADVIPGACMNPLDVADPGVFLVNLLGRADLDLCDLHLPSVRLSRVDGFGAPLRPMFFSLGDTGSPAVDGVCPTQQPDGFADALLRFSCPEAVHLLRLDREPTHGVLAVELTGRLTDGTQFRARDVLQVERP